MSLLITQASFFFSLCSFCRLLSYCDFIFDSARKIIIVIIPAPTNQSKTYPSSIINITHAVIVKPPLISLIAICNLNKPYKLRRAVIQNQFPSRPRSLKNSTRPGCLVTTRSIFLSFFMVTPPSFFLCFNLLTVSPW